MTRASVIACVILPCALQAIVTAQKSLPTIAAPVVDRSKLGLLSSWRAVIVDFATPSSTAGSLTINKVQARQVMYRTSREQMIGLLAVTDPETNYSYVVRYGQTFYLRYESDILGCAVGIGGFAWIKSHFKMPPAQNGVARVVERFAAEVDDNALLQMESHYRTVDLRQGLPFPFFTAKSMGGSQPAIPTVKGLELTGALLTLHLVSDGGKYQGTASIDLNSGKLIRSSVDGTEVYKAR